MMTENNAFSFPGNRSKEAIIEKSGKGNFL